jgi:histidine triad (HIT) family protein
LDAAGCVFCRIVDGEVEAEIVQEDRDVLAFKDADGRAPVHALVIPKRHIGSLEEVSDLPEGVAGRLLEVSGEVAAKLGVGESGYAVRINNGPDAGQEVPHLHLHVLGGQRIGMP